MSSQTNRQTSSQTNRQTSSQTSSQTKSQWLITMRRPDGAADYRIHTGSWDDVIHYADALCRSGHDELAVRPVGAPLPVLSF